MIHVGCLIYRGTATCHFTGLEIRRLIALRVHLAFKERRFPSCRRSFRTSNLQVFRKTREDSATCLRDDDYVFLARAAHARIIQTGFDCKHLPLL